MNRLLAACWMLLLGFVPTVQAMHVQLTADQSFPAAVSASPDSYALIIDAGFSAEKNICRNNPIDNVDPYGLIGEGFIYNWIAEQIDSGFSGSQSEFWSFTGSMAAQVLQMGAGFDPSFTSYQQTTHQVQVYRAYGAGEGTKTLGKEAAWQLAEFTPVPDVKRALDPNASTLAKVGYWSSAGGKTILIVMPIKAAVAGKLSPAAAEASIKPPPLPSAASAIAGEADATAIASAEQAFIERAVNTWLSDLKLSAKPQYDATLTTEGLARIWQSGKMEIHVGPKSVAKGLEDVVDTVLHEEIHLRWTEMSHTDLQALIVRYMRMRGW